MKTFEFIDVSGVGHSGKSAAVDILREIEHTYACPFQFEFDLIRVTGGILDLRHHLVEDWSPIRSNDAINEFLRVSRLIGSGEAGGLRAWLFSSGQAYNLLFQGRFTEITEKFTRQFVKGSFRAFWPYSLVNDSPFVRLKKKIFLKFKFQTRVLEEIKIVSAENFDERVTAYMNELFGVLAQTEDHRVVLNNSFEPFNPNRSLDMIKNSKQIIVLRDPRDIYVSGKNAHSVSKSDQKLQSSDNDGINKSFLASDDLSLFILRYKSYLSHLFRRDDSRVLILYFEDLVLNYEESLEKIYTFLGIDSNHHQAKRKIFIPELSSRNIELYKLYSNQNDVRVIERELKSALYTP